MRTFIHLRRMIGSHEDLARKLTGLEARLAEHDEQIQAIFEAIRQLMAPPDRGAVASNGRRPFRPGLKYAEPRRDSDGGSRCENEQARRGILRPDSQDL
jgi:hypothetical protein